MHADVPEQSVGVAEDLELLEHTLGLWRTPLDWESAQHIIAKVCADWDCTVPELHLGRRTRKCRGFYEYGTRGCSITLNSPGWNAATMLHELAHHVAREKCGSTNHNAAFNRMYRAILGRAETYMA